MQKIFVIASALAFAVACQSKPTNKSTVNTDSVAHPEQGHHHGHHHGKIVQGTQADLEENVGDRVFFTFDSSSLNSESQAVLTRQVAWLKANSNVNISVQGHCDKRGTREYNIGLGERRANAAKNFLVNAGIDSNRISTISYGKEQPAELGDNEEVYSKNRRSVTVVVN